MEHRLDEAKRNYAWEKIYTDMGPVDAIYHDNSSDPVTQLWTIPMKTRWPGRDLPPDAQAQQMEKEVMTVDDYEWVIRSGLAPKRLLYEIFLTKMLRRTYAGLPDNVVRMTLTLYRGLYKDALWFRRFRKKRERRGVPRLWGSALMVPFDNFSLLRSITPFSMDMFQRPEQIAEAADACVNGVVFLLKRVADLIGTPRAWIFLHRSSKSFISPGQFKTLSFPSLQAIVSRLAAQGMDLVLHCDGDWNKNLEILLDLPPKKCMIQLDGTNGHLQGQRHVERTFLHLRRCTRPDAGDGKRGGCGSVLQATDRNRRQERRLLPRVRL